MVKCEALSLPSILYFALQSGEWNKFTYEAALQYSGPAFTMMLPTAKDRNTLFNGLPAGLRKKRRAVFHQQCPTVIQTLAT